VTASLTPPVGYVFYTPGKRWAEDGAVLVDGVYRGQYSGKTLADYPGAELLTEEDAFNQIEALCITAPKEIDRERFMYLLEVLPPVSWHGCGSPTESFKLCEFTNGRVTCIAVRVEARYFEFEDVETMPHADCVAKVRTWLAAQDVVTLNSD